MYRHSTSAGSLNTTMNQRNTPKMSKLKREINLEQAINKHIHKHIYVLMHKMGLLVVKSVI